MNDASLDAAIASVPAGAWAVGVSGGADSVALLSLLRNRGDLSLHVVHLDHQTRGEQSTADAEFVDELSARWNLPRTIARLDEIIVSDPPANLSARFRAARFALFQQVVKSNNLSGVILAHHADDQAETVLHRLLRRSVHAGLSGISARAVVGGLVIVRPLLSVRKKDLQEHLNREKICWREDASNQSPKYLRNRLRQILAHHPQLSSELISLSAASARLRNWSRSAAPVFGERISAKELAVLPNILARESARKWLIDRGAPAKLIESAVLERLILMASDAATGARQDFPGNIHVRRRGGILFVD